MFDADDFTVQTQDQCRYFEHYFSLMCVCLDVKDKTYFVKHVHVVFHICWYRLHIERTHRSCATIQTSCIRFLYLGVYYS